MQGSSSLPWPLRPGRSLLEASGPTPPAGHFLSSAHLIASRFCEHGVWGDACGNGICVNGVRCVCDEGYVHDSGLFYYANCFTPWFLYPLLHWFAVTLSAIVVVCAVALSMRSPPGPARRVVLLVAVYAIVFLLLVLSIEVEGRMGVASDVGHGIGIVLMFGLLVPNALDLYISPAFQFSRSRIYTKTKQRLMYVSIACAFIYGAMCFMAERRLRGSADLKGSNDMRAALHIFMALFCLLIALIFQLAFRKTIAALTNIQRQAGQALDDQTDREPLPQQRIASQQQAGESQALSEQAKGHRKRVETAQNMILGVLLTTALTDVLLSGVHFYFQIYPYQYLFFMSMLWGSPMFCVAILYLVHDHIAQITTNRSSEDPQSNPTREIVEGNGNYGNSAAGLLFRGRRNGLANQQSASDVGYSREADSGASGFSVTLTRS